MRNGFDLEALALLTGYSLEEIKEIINWLETSKCPPINNLPYQNV
ncbi:hypothetical protein [Solibacillus sp. R5-41]|nr:hypothetical protein [Solibacillus sp. R5-41]